MSRFFSPFDARAARVVATLFVVLVAAAASFVPLRSAFADPVPPDPSADVADESVQQSAAAGARVVVHAAGARQGGGTTPLAGASFQASADSGSGGAAPVATCTTSGGGSCELTGLEPGVRYLVRLIAAPPPYQALDTLTETTGGSRAYGDRVTTGGPGSATDTRVFVARRTNPPFPGVCGLDIALVMDLSNSIDPAELTQMKTAARGFVTALQGTPSSVAGFTFATEAPAGGNADLDFTDVSGASGADRVRAWIDGRTEPGDSAGGTNWDAALRQLVPKAAEPDVVVFLTDGNPTFSGVPHDAGNGSDTTFAEVEAGVLSANALKAANPALKVVGVAIGDRAAVDNLGAVAGPELGDDLYLAADFGDLQAKLQDLATKLCGGTVTVRKLVDGPDGFRPAGGWTFTVGGATPPTGVTAAETGVTPALDVAAGTVTITETRQRGYDLVSQQGRHASCTRNGGPVAPVDLTDVDNGVELHVSALDIVACEFRNRAAPATLRVDKVWADGVDGDAPPRATLHVAGPTSADTVVTGPSPGTTGALTVVPGTYSVFESDVSAGWRAGGVSCRGQDDGPELGAAAFAIGPGDHIVCLFTNARASATLRIDKVWLGATSDERPRAVVDVSGPSPSSTPMTGPEFGTTGPLTVVTGVYAVTESALSNGWDQQSITCAIDDGPAFTPTADGIEVSEGDVVVCTVINAKRGSITIVKDARPRSTHEFGFTTDGLGGRFTLRDDGTDANRHVFRGLRAGAYAVTEEATPGGWIVADVECAGTGGAGDVTTRTASIELPPGGDVTCTFTNHGPDVAIEKTDAPDPVVAGTDLEYHLSVRNHGPAAAGPVEVRDPLPPETTFVSLDAGAGWSCTTPPVGERGLVTCVLVTLPTGSAPRLTLVVHVAPGTAAGDDVIVNTATVTAPGDTQLGDNSSTATTSVVRAVDLAVTKSDGGATPVGGQAGFTYTMTVDNQGPSDAATAATVVDLLPSGIEFVAYDTLPDGVRCAPPVGRTLECTVAAELLAVADAAVTIPVDVTVPASTPAGTVTNRVVVDSSEDPAPCEVTDATIACDPSDTDNYAEETTPIIQIEAEVVPPPAPPSATPPSVPPAPRLALTGGGRVKLTAIGVTLVALGSALVVVFRRRRREARG